ncbi:MAG: HYR domain-containing protein, partial [Blastocatellia bacterium]
MRYLHKLRTRTLLIILALVIAIGAASVIPGVSNAARGYSNRLISAITPTAPAAVKAAPMAVVQDKNVQPGKPEPPPEFSVIEYNGPKAPAQNNATRLAAATTANEVEPNNTFGTANAIGTDVKVVGNVFPNADEDWYSFTAATGDKVHAAVMTSFSANASSDSQLRLFQSDGTTLIEFDDDDGALGGLSSSIAGATIPSAGTYYLQVKHFSATNQLRPYELWLKLQSGSPTPEVEGNDTPATANPLPASGYVSGSRNPAIATEQDWYSFTANAGDTIFLSLDLDPERDNVQWNGRLGMALFGDAANQILVVDDASTGSVANPLSEFFVMTVKDAGTYFAFVDSASAATGGPTATYGLSVSVLPRANVGVNCTTYTSANVPQTIGPGAGLVSSTITIPGNPRIAQIRVTLDITHALMSDLDIHLRSPAGNDNGLFTDIGATATGGQTQMVLTLDDNAGIPPAFTVLKGVVVKPELAYRLGWFNGEDAGGTWTLDIRDDTANASGGTLNGWSIEICEMPPAPSCGAGFAQTTVFSTDFEAGDAGFTHSGVTDEWERGNPTFAPVTGCNSGSNCWKTDLDNTYNAGVSAGTPQDLLSPPINLAGLSGPITLTWAMKYQLENATFDPAFVEVREVGGANPKRVWEWLDATMTNAIGSPAVTIQESAGWAIYRADISSFAGQNIEIRFNLTTDNTVQLAGLAIDDVSVTACRALSADLQITKTDGVATATPGGSVTYTIVASNSGPDAVTGATVADTFPAVITGATWTCVGAGGGTCTANGSGNINDTVNLPSGGSVTYTVTAPISASATGTLSNTATVSSSITDPVPANNSATDTDTLTPMANLAITKTNGVTSVTAGNSVTYTIIASNSGPSNAPGSMVTDLFPPVITGVTWTCVGAGGATCTANGSGNITDTVNLPVGGLVTYTATGTLSASATGMLINTAVVLTAGGVTDPTPGNNSAMDSDTIISCTLTCPANITINTDPGQCSAVVTYSAPTTSGSCGTVTCTPASGATYQKGTTTVTCTSSITGSCSFTVTVNDNQPPALTCPANISVNGSAPTAVTYTPPTPTDNCSGATVNCLPASGSTFAVGTTTVTCTATDAAMLTATCTFTVSVTPCTITCPTNQVAWTSTTSATVNYPAPTTTGSCGTVTCTPASGSTFNVGTTQVTCNTTAGPSCSFNVVVNQLTLGASLADPLACNGP